MSKPTLSAAVAAATMSASAAAADASASATEFFRVYNTRNVPNMISLFEPGGIVEYVPLDLAGPVEEVGPGSWGVLIDAFPDLRNEIKSVTVDATGRRAFVDVYIGGTQTKMAFTIENRGRSYWLRHMFVFDVAESGRISRVTSYWDSAGWYQQLGKDDLP